jgi:hypothetical protein
MEKKVTTLKVGRDVEKLDCSHFTGGMVTWHNQPGNLAWHSLRILNMQLPYDPAIPPWKSILEK